MSHRILIADDDQEFSLLLKDVYAQADYEVEAFASASSAWERVQAGGIDLVVTDFRMPGESGLELIGKVRSRDPELPVIMVSGYLESETVRELISMGVGGVFMKPLNILHLLKKTAELLERASVRASAEAAVVTSGFGANVGYTFRALPCRDPRSREFARRVFSLRDFSRNLLLIAPSGSDVLTLSEDLVAASGHCRELLSFDPGTFVQEAVLESLRGAAEADGGGVTYLIHSAEKLSATQKGMLYRLARREGVFRGDDLPRRFIFCLQKEVDEYYDAGEIDEEFYLFLGATEVKFPPLKELPEDLPIIAEGLLAREHPDRVLETSALAFLHNHPWNGNLEELQETLRRAAEGSQKSSIGMAELRAVFGMDEAVDLPAVDSGEEGAPLETFLCGRRQDYLESLQRLSVPPGTHRNTVRTVATLD